MHTSFYRDLKALRLAGMAAVLFGSITVVPMSGFFLVLLVIAVVAWLVFRRRR